MELIHGEVIVTPTGVPQHGNITGNTFGWILVNKPDGRAYHAPQDIHLDEETVLQPDVLWISGARLHIITEKRIEGAPDLVVEVYSPSTAYRDRGVKYALYEKFGVHEYWMIDPASRFIEVYTLQNAAFVRHGVYAPGETFASPVFGGKTVDVAALFA
jgi:Uma2 family endonuclease